jgi:hypothetical protein
MPRTGIWIYATGLVASLIFLFCAAPITNAQRFSVVYNNSATLGTATISGGKAIFTTSALPSGSGQVSATYTRTADYSSASDTVTQTVN